MGAKKEGEDDGGDLDDDAQICSCHNVLKGTIGACVKEGITELAQIKKKTKAGAGGLSTGGWRGREDFALTLLAAT